jgi:hypothetical protein
MLAQKLSGGVAGPRQRQNGPGVSLSALILICLCLSALHLACSSAPSDLRSMVPGDALVYLESNDLSATLGAVTAGKAFAEISPSKPDLSALRGVQAAVAVTGFEMSEQQVTDENSVGRIRPHFVAVADTHAWRWQTMHFAEDQLGEFVNKVYGGGVDLDVSDKHDGRFFTWTANDGRKAFALVQGSIIYFANDESSIEKCLAVKRGEADGMNKNTKIPPPKPDSIASGYVSPDGILQIANLVGLTMAAGSDEENEVKSFIARVVPPLLQRSVTEVNWTSSAANGKIEDTYDIGLAPDVASVLSETLAGAAAPDNSLAAYIAPDALSATMYNLRDPQVAWRSLLLLAQKQSDAVAGKILAEFSGALFEPYGIRDPEMFLSSVAGNIITARFDEEGDDLVVVASVKDAAKARSSIDPKLTPMPNAAVGEVYKTTDGDTEVVFIDGKLILGDPAAVEKCLDAKRSGIGFVNNELVADMPSRKGIVVTAGKDGTSAAKVVEMMAGKPDRAAATGYYVETNLSRGVLERRTTSDLGLIGAIIVQLAGEE